MPELTKNNIRLTTFRYDKDTPLASPVIGQ